MIRRFAATAGVLATAAAAALPTAASAFRAPPQPVARPNFDLRIQQSAAAAAPSLAGSRGARQSLRRSLGAGSTLSVDPVTGTASMIQKRGAALTGPSSQDHLTVVDRYVRQHAAAIGLTADDLGSLSLMSDVATPGGVHYLRWRQTENGIPLFDGGVSAVVAGDGRLVTVGGSPVHGLAAAATTPSLDAPSALKLARDDARASGSVQRLSGPTGAQQSTTFRGGDSAELVLYATADGPRLAWDTIVHASSVAVYNTLVDAKSGAILHRANMVKFAANASAWQNYPGAPAGGTQSTIDMQAKGWLPASATNLTGPFAHVCSDIHDDDCATGDEVGRLNGQFQFTFFDFTSSNTDASCDSAHRCSWDADTDTSWQDNESQNATQVFAFVNQFHDHLAAPPIGFNAASDNFEGADRVFAQPDDGADTNGSGGPDGNHVNNANMLTLPEGQSPTMQMYLFEGSRLRDVNGGDDAAIVYHEYTHGLSSRLITFSNGVQALNSDQSGAMGEAWSDWYAMDFLVNQGLEVDTSAPGELDMGKYTDRTPHVIRTQAIDCPVGAPEPCHGGDTPHFGGYTYGDFGTICCGQPEVHADGEIWGETLWDMRGALGSNVSEALITGGMRGTPPEPSFLDARDAILAADVALFGGHHQAALWRVFANRGMGSNASTSDGGDDFPNEGFNAPPDQAPAGSLSATPNALAPGGSVHFDASSFNDPDGTVTQYQWDFNGDGTPDLTTGSPTADFAYPAAGSFTASVTATDDGGKTGTATAPVQVTSPPPPPNLLTNPLAPSVKIAKKGKKGAANVTVTCDSTCDVKAKLAVNKKTARSLGLGKKRTVGSRHLTETAGKHTFKVKLTGKVLKALKRHHRKSLRTTLKLTVRDAESQVKNSTVAVTIKR